MEEKYSKFLNEKKILTKSLRFKSNRHNLSTINVNKITLTSNNNKRMQSFDCRRTFQGIVNEHFHMEQ